MISKMGVKMNLRLITKNHAADPEIGFLTKPISKPYDCAMAMSQAWELNGLNSLMIINYLYFACNKK